MKLPPPVEKIFARFDAMSLRERVLTAGALVAALIMIWTVAVLDPMAGQHSALLAEQSMLEEQIAAAQSGVESAAATDPVTLALAKEKTLQASLDVVNHELASESAGLIPPERMVQLIQDVLSRQRGVSLVSLHNKSVTSLVQSFEPIAPAEAAATLPSDGSEEDAPAAEATSAIDASEELTGPFVHPIEIVVEGTYLDVLAYLKALEALDWRFYWRVLELETQQYPKNRVRIELSTLSMDKDWIGV
jgi:MSHA biogenesis protein MshJ